MKKSNDWKSSYIHIHHLRVRFCWDSLVRDQSARRSHIIRFFRMKKVASIGGDREVDDCLHTPCYTCDDPSLQGGIVPSSMSRPPRARRGYTFLGLMAARPP